MIAGVSRIATPLFATISFLFLAAVIRSTGLAHTISEACHPMLNVAPVQAMLILASITALLTQSYAASAAIVIPFLEAVIEAGADPMAAGLAAAGGAALMQYFLTGGPISALATIIPVIPGSELKAANRFQCPSILSGVLVALIISALLNL